MSTSRLKYLLQQWFDRTATPEEIAELQDLLQQPALDEPLRVMLEDLWQQFTPDAKLAPEKADQVFTQILAQERPVNEQDTRIQAPALTVAASRKRYKIITWAAAAVLLLIAAGAWYYRLRPDTITHTPQLAKQQPLIPGGNRAILQLANGNTIVLDSAANGVLAMEGSTQVKKAKDGSLIYEPAAGSDTSAKALNIITTPKGGQYQITLPDGTKVWLNAASSLTFPTVFSGAARKVELTGEAYFEVAKINRALNGVVSRMPFFVATGHTEVSVLGTHFNVMAYPDAGVQEITLLEGAVQVSHGKDIQRIQPGQQAAVPNQEGAAMLIKPANIDAVMAWKQGLFLFDDTDIENAMSQLRRWYDARIVYEGGKPDAVFTGVLPRSSDVNTVLNMLASTRKVSFTVKDNVITVHHHHQ
ncbi:DUF4974 domain-containing protein [Chitinophaga agrisoli]|uniref:DUF4974 domain-containing protein n=1 Tax=Chitinophaga agrisoli TaxID=2607653 RepID=A0A5B2VJE8_9BACT|nr:FecR domain-containing protein [Chitinophaga agrisoli]KAA2238482.1 DUF4974 domain-containing protein [Chitinophaga agrisoli]